MNDLRTPSSRHSTPTVRSKRLAGRPARTTRAHRKWNKPPPDCWTKRHWPTTLTSAKRVVEIHRAHEQVIDETSADSIPKPATRMTQPIEPSTIESFRQFIEDNKDEITALQILYSQPYGARQLTFQQIKELADTISLPPRRWTPEALWTAYETLERTKVHGSTKTVLTNLVSLVRHASGPDETNLSPSDQGAERFAAWLRQQEQAGRTSTPEQMQWLGWIRDHIGDSLRITADDFDYTPFAEHRRHRRCLLGLRRPAHRAPRRTQRGTRRMTVLPPGWGKIATIDDLVATSPITDGPFGSNLKTSHYTDDRHNEHPPPEHRRHRLLTSMALHLGGARRSRTLASRRGGAGRSHSSPRSELSCRETVLPGFYRASH